MGDETAIAWADSTFNAWMGCMKISPGCKNCYAETLTRDRMGLKVYGPASTTPRKVTGAATWAKPLAWGRAAKKSGLVHRVFCGSLMDWAEDHPTAIATLPRLWALIEQTPHLTWMLLTKRADRIAESLPKSWGQGWPNVWLGVSCERQAEADLRIAELVRIRAAVRFVSLEPLLAPIALAPWLSFGGTRPALDQSGYDMIPGSAPRSLIDWVIVGGESGRGYRPMDHQWAREIRDQCAAAGVAFFFKQSAAPRTEMGITLDGKVLRAWPKPRVLAPPSGLFA